MRVRCPHCHDPLELPADSHLSGICCTTCGSSFSLVPEETATLQGGKVRTIGHFELVEQVGAGQFGTVWKARDTQLDREVAVKLPRRAQLDAAESELFLREARAAAQLQHANIVSIHEVGREGQTIFIVSDFVTGASLEDQFTAHRPTPREAAELCVKICDGLEHAHLAGVVHRDLKPGNIMIDSGGEPHIMDFGLAKRDAGEVTLTVEGRMLGTPAYMSPEQARGHAHQADRRSDVYSLGVILFRLLTAELPFRGNVRMLVTQIINDEPPALRKLDSTVPRDLETICLKCLRKDPDSRYQTAAALQADLRRWVQGKPIQARPVGRLERVSRWCRRNPLVATSVGLAAASLVAVAAVSLALAIHRARTAQNLLRQQRQAMITATNLAIDRGLDLCERGDVGLGTLWFARSLQIAPADAEQLERVSRANVSAWRHNLHELNDILPHAAPVLTVAFSPDGLTALTGTSDGTVMLWDRRTVKAARLPRTSSTSVTAAAFHPDGSPLAIASGNQVRLWDLVTLKPLDVTIEHSERITAVTFSSDGKLVATASLDDTARLWEFPTGRPFGEPLRHVEFGVSDVSFSADGTLIATVGGDWKAQIWDAETTKLVGEPLRTSFFPNAVAFGPGRGLLAIAAGNQVQLVDVASRQPDGPPLEHQGTVYSLAFSPEGRLLATGSTDGMVRLWNLATRDREGQQLRHTATIRDLAFSPDGRTLLAGCTEARLWSIAIGSPLRQIFRSSGAILGVDYSVDNRTIATAGTTGVGHLWNTSTGRMIGQMNSAAAFQDVAFSSNGEDVVTADRDGVRFWNATTAKRGEMSIDISGWTRDIVFARCGKIATSGDDRTVRVWEASDGRLIGRPLVYGERVADIVFSRDERLVLAASGGKAQFWDVETGKPVGKSFKHDRISRIALSPDGQTVATRGAKEVRLWERTSGNPVGAAFSFVGNIFSLAFSPTGDMLLVGTSAATRLLHLSSGKMIGPPLKHEHRVTSAVFSPDGKTALTGSMDRTARLWYSPEAMSGSTQQIVLSAQLRTGMELDERGAVRGLSGAAWRRRRQQLASLQREPAAAEPRHASQANALWQRRRAEIARLDEDWSAVVWHLDRLIALRPDDWWHRADRGDAYVMMGNWQRAIEDFSRALESTPRQWSVRVQRGHALAELQRFNEAGEDFALAIDSDATDPSVWYALALIQVSNGSVEAYRRTCDDLLSQQFGQLPAPWTSLTCALGSNSVADLERPVKLARRAVARNPHFLNLWALATSLFRAGRPREALEQLHASIQKNDGIGTPDDWLLLAMIHARLGDTDEAKLWFNKAIQQIESPAAEETTMWQVGLELELLRREAESLINAGESLSGSES